MAIEIFPTDQDVGGSLKGREFNEDKWAEVFGNCGGHNYIVSGYDTATIGGGSLTVTFNAGVAVINGFRAKNQTSGLSITLTASQSDCHIYLQMTEDGSNDLNGVQLVEKTDETVPARSVLLLWAKTNATGVTDYFDRRPRNAVSASGAYKGDGGGVFDVVLGFTPRLVHLINNGATEWVTIFRIDDSYTSYRIHYNEAGPAIAIAAAGGTESRIIAGGIATHVNQGQNSGNQDRYIAIS